MVMRLKYALNKNVLFYKNTRNKWAQFIKHRPFTVQELWDTVVEAFTRIRWHVVPVPSLEVYHRNMIYGTVILILSGMM